MKFIASVLLFALLSATVMAQGTEIKFQIDEFTEAQGVLVVSTAAISQPSDFITDTNSVSGPSMLGGFRDMSVTLTQALGANSVLSSAVGQGTWTTAVPTDSSGISFIQYDGNDGSDALDANGLGGENFENNLGSEVLLTISSDLPATYVVTVYSAGSQCSVDVDVPAGVVDTDFVLPFTQFSGNCDFTNVGAVEVEADASDNVDSSVSFFGVRGDIPPSASSSPSPSPSASQNPSASASRSQDPSASRTPSPDPSANPTPSPTRTRTPTPTPVIEQCHCQCPAFTCELIFDPDDDDNNAFYFDDDDDNANAGNNSGSGSGSGSGSSNSGSSSSSSGSSSSSSDASALKITFTAALVVVLAALF